MNHFAELLLLPGAAPILATKLSGRLIGRMANGFADDPALEPMMSLFKCIEAKWPDQTMSLRAMFNLQVERAEKEDPGLHEAVEGLTPEQREIWEKGQKTASPKEKLLAILPDVLNLYHRVEPTMDAWEDLTVINQWSLLNRTEASLHQRLKQYQGWAADDRQRGRTESNAMLLAEDAADAIKPMFDLVSDFLADKHVQTELQHDADHGIRVPERIVA